MGDGGEHEPKLDDVFGIWVMIRSCEKRIETKLATLTVAKVLENKFGKVVEKTSDLILCLSGFVKATKSRDASGFSQCIQNVLSKSCLSYKIYIHVQTLYKPKKLFAEYGKA